MSEKEKGLAYDKDKHCEFCGNPGFGCCIPCGEWYDAVSRFEESHFEENTRPSYSAVDAYAKRTWLEIRNGE